MKYQYILEKIHFIHYSNNNENKYFPHLPIAQKKIKTPTE